MSIERERREDIEREEEARAERLEQSREYLEQSRENAERVAEARINPGDYDCPECLYRTLKYRAKRCPTCQANIGTEYWNRIDEREKVEAERARAAAKAAKEKWESEAPAREKAARDAAEKEARAAAVGRSKTFFAYFYGYILPTLCIFSGQLIETGSPLAFVHHMQNHIPDTLLTFVPVLNWVLILLLLLFSNDRPVILMTLVCLGLVGLAIGYAIRKSSTSK